MLALALPAFGASNKTYKRALGAVKVVLGNPENEGGVVEARYASRSSIGGCTKVLCTLRMTDAKIHPTRV